MLRTANAFSCCQGSFLDFRGLGINELHESALRMLHSKQSVHGYIQAVLEGCTQCLWYSMKVIPVEPKGQWILHFGNMGSNVECIDIQIYIILTYEISFSRERCKPKKTKHSGSCNTQVVLLMLEGKIK